MKNSIFNRKDKLNDKIKYYLELFSYSKAHIARKEGFKYDPECKKWYTRINDPSFIRNV